MKILPTWEKTERIERTLADLLVLKTAFHLIPYKKEDAVLLRRRSLLKSALFSARIEGNTLSESDMVFGVTGKEREKKEIQNMVAAYEFLDIHPSKEMDRDSIKQLHRIIADNVISDPGLFRIEESAIFNTAGIAIYLTPTPKDIYPLLDEWVKYVNTSDDVGPVRAAIAQYWLEKIHPFLDGNGRVGRLISYWVLKQTDYDFGGFVPIEEYLDDHKDQYYFGLSRSINDATVFVEYYVEALLSQARKSLEEAKKPQDEHSHLLPRRAEILMVIKEHKMVSFDAIRRRFLAVSVRTLHYDLTQLIKDGFITKIGSTRGVLYTTMERK